MAWLPADVLQMVLLNVYTGNGLETLAACARVSKAWNRTASSVGIWAVMYNRRWGTLQVRVPRVGSSLEDPHPRVAFRHALLVEKHFAAILADCRNSIMHESHEKVTWKGYERASLLSPGDVAPLMDLTENGPSNAPLDIIFRFSHHLEVIHNANSSEELMLLLHLLLASPRHSSALAANKKQLFHLAEVLLKLADRHDATWLIKERAMAAIGRLCRLGWRPSDGGASLAHWFTYQPTPASASAASFAQDPARQLVFAFASNIRSASPELRSVLSLYHVRVFPLLESEVARFRVLAILGAEQKVDNYKAAFTEYIVDVRSGYERWQIRRRFREFRALYLDLIAAIPRISGIEFPPREVVPGAFTFLAMVYRSEPSKHKDDRQAVLGRFLTAIAEDPEVFRHAIMQQFLDRNRPQSSL